VTPICSGRYGPVADWLDSQAKSARAFTGYQLCVLSASTEPCDIAGGSDGLGRAVTRSSQFSVYCACKPLVAATVADLISRKRLSADQSLGSVISDLPECLSNASIADLLEHRLPLVSPAGFATVLTNPSLRRTSVLGAAVQADLEGAPLGYSEVGAWLLLAEVVEAATGREWHDACESLIDRTCGDMSREISLTPEQIVLAAEGGRLLTNVRIRDGIPIPLLGEIAPGFIRRVWSPGFGPVASARALATFLRGTLSSGAFGSLLDEVEAATSDEPDPTFSVPLAFRSGLMVGLTGLGVSDLWGPSIVGHTGLGNMTTVFHSSVHDATVAVHLNGMMAPDEGPQFVVNHLTAELAAIFSLG
jgi:CubicO group peptidase (beta-lactamase class C family)